MRPKRDERPTKHVPPTRTPRFGFGVTLRTHAGREAFVGRVDAIYADYWAAVDSNVIPSGWFEMQNVKPSTKDQVFYGLIALDGRGAILAGEQECVQA